MKKICSFIAISISAALLSSCGDNESDPVIEVQDPITAGQITPSSFSASIAGTFKDINKLDIALGKHGVLFCPKTDNAAQIFQSWQKGNDNPDCSISGKGTFSGDYYTCTIYGLYPETEYSYCLFLQNMDNSAREISAVGTFTTTAFNPGFDALKFGNIHFIDAEATVNSTMSMLDAAGCTIGVMLSQTSGFDAGNAQAIIDYTGQFGKMMVVKVTGIKPDSTYFCRPFARYKTNNGDDEYVYGPESSFSTMTSAQMRVDLGLPSGIMWANCDLGDYRFSNNRRTAPYYKWGSMKEVIYLLNEQQGFWEKINQEYEYYDKVAETYADLGTEISGTQYDIAHQSLGGKWRMPTKADVEELMENIKQVTTRNSTYRDFVMVNGEKYEYDSSVRIHELTGPNNNRISFLDYEDYWCGSVCETDYSAAYSFSCIFINNSPSLSLNHSIRISDMHIRPIWDPNM